MYKSDNSQNYNKKYSAINNILTKNISNYNLTVIIFKKIILTYPFFQKMKYLKINLIIKLLIIKNHKY